MKKIIFSSMILAILFSSLFNTPTPAKAALALTVVSDKVSGVYYADNGLSVSLKTYPGAIIVYTTDGTTPQAKMQLSMLNSLVITHGKKYTAPIPVTGNQIIKAIALYNILTPISPVAVFSYEVYKPSALANAVAQKFSSFNYNAFPDDVKYKAADGKESSLSKRYIGITPGTVNCTWYTFVRIKFNLGRSVLFSSIGGLDGKNWYGKIVGNTNQIKYANLESLVKANNNRPVYNIVVSFERNPGGTNGHVLLIDAIINGKIYYSDNFKPGVLLTSNSIAEFKSKYSTSNGNIVGVVHLK